MKRQRGVGLEERAGEGQCLGGGIGDAGHGDAGDGDAGDRDGDGDHLAFL